MGDYRFTFEAVGGHGCQRELGDGATVYGCGLRSCPDCEIRAFVARMKAMGQDVKHAELQHWPETTSEVIDNLLTGIRRHSFK